MSSTQLPSLYIPFVYSQTTEEKIKHVIEVSYGFGKVAYMDRVLREDANGSYHYSVYIHFETFNFDEITEKFLEHAKDKKDPPRLYYDYGKPWFWKVMINTKVGKNMHPHVKVDHLVPDFQRPEFQVPPRDSFFQNLNVHTLKSMTDQVNALPVAPTLPDPFPEMSLSLKKPEDCDGWNEEGWNEEMSDLSDDGEEEEKDNPDDKFPTIELNRDAAPFVPICHPSRVFPTFELYEYKESDSKLLARLSEKCEQSFVDYYEGTSEEATGTMFDDYEGSSLDAIMQLLDA